MANRGQLFYALLLHIPIYSVTLIKQSVSLIIINTKWKKRISYSSYTATVTRCIY